MREHLSHDRKAVTPSRPLETQQHCDLGATFRLHRYEVGRFFGAVERLKRASEEQHNREAQKAFAAMSVAYDRYLKVPQLTSTGWCMCLLAFLSSSGPADMKPKLTAGVVVVVWWAGRVECMFFFPTTRIMVAFEVLKTPLAALCPCFGGQTIWNYSSVGKFLQYIL